MLIILQIESRVISNKYMRLAERRAGRVTLHESYGPPTGKSGLRDISPWLASSNWARETCLQILGHSCHPEAEYKSPLLDRLDLVMERRYCLFLTLRSLVLGSQPPCWKEAQEGSQPAARTKGAAFTGVIFQVFLASWPLLSCPC